MTPEQKAVLGNIRKRRASISADPRQRAGYQTEQDVLRQIQARRDKRSDEAGPLEAVGQAAENLWPSIKEMGSSIAYPFTHPTETWEGIKRMGSEIGSLNPVFRGEALQSKTPALDAMGGYFKDRYGSGQALKRTATQDPAGFLADASIPLTSGGAALSNAPGVVGKAGQLARKAGAAIDPINVGVQGGKLSARLAGDVAGAAGKYFAGYTTGAGPRAIEEAYQAGKAKSPAFRQAMRREEGLEDILHDVEANVQTMQRAKSQAYKSGIQSTQANTERLSFDSIDAKMRELSESLTYKSKSMFDESELKQVKQMMDLIEDWKNSPDVHDAGGFDALKRRIDQVNINPKDHPNAYRIKTSLRNEVKKTIVDQVPEYAEVMRDYENATAELRDIRKTLALNPNASVDQQINRLRRLMERGVTEGKERLLNKIDLPGTSITERLAGFQMKEPLPKGLARYVGLSSLGIGAMAAGSPWPLAMLPAQSPRLVGEGTYALGRGMRLAEDLASAIPLQPRAVGQGFFQTGRLAEELQRR